MAESWTDYYLKNTMLNEELEWTIKSRISKRASPKTQNDAIRVLNSNQCDAAQAVIEEHD